MILEIWQNNKLDGSFEEGRATRDAAAELFRQRGEIRGVYGSRGSRFGMWEVPQRKRMRRVHPSQMLPGIDVLKTRISGFVLLFFCLVSVSLAQDQIDPPREDNRGIYAIVRDAQGERWEGFLRFDAEEIAVRSPDNQEKKVPVKYIKAITLEKVKNEFAADDQKSGVQYTVRVENSQEIFTLDKKYTFSLNTNLGLTTKSLDPDLVNKVISKEFQGTRLDDGRSLIQDKSIIFSLEVKF